MIGRLVLLLLMPLVAGAQTVARNPSGVAFQCPDHATDTNHEIDIVRVSDGVVVQTLLGGDPPLTGTEVVIPVNVQPVAFGQYRFVVRAVAGSVTSENSLPSPIWERVPGRPTNVEPR